MRPIEIEGAVAGEERWDGVSVYEFEGTYGDYLLAKVLKVFPELGEDVIGGPLFSADAVRRRKSEIVDLLRAGLAVPRTSRAPV